MASDNDNGLRYREEPEARTMIYVYRCPGCKQAVEEMKPVEQRFEAPHCAACDMAMALEIQPVPVSVDMPAVPRST